VTPDGPQFKRIPLLLSDTELLSTASDSESEAASKPPSSAAPDGLELEQCTSAAAITSAVDDAKTSLPGPCASHVKHLNEEHTIQ
jgi:hypothetical protein